MARSARSQAARGTSAQRPRKEASAPKAPYVAANHAIRGIARPIAKEGDKNALHTNVIGEGCCKTLLVEKQIPEQAKDIDGSEKNFVNEAMLDETERKAFTTVEDVANVALFFASFPNNALTGESIVVSHGWRMG